MNFFDQLRDLLFGKAKVPPANQPIILGTKPRTSTERSPGGKPTTKPADPPQPPRERFLPKPRSAYLVQIGFDFGTAFSKCVCRDIHTGKAWIHLHDAKAAPELPFLISSSLTFRSGVLGHQDACNGAYTEGGLHHVKMALEKVALGQWRDPVLTAYYEAAPSQSPEMVTKFVESCAIYLLGGAFGTVRRSIGDRFPGKVDGDHVQINMAMPVADANHPDVDALFSRVLRRAWVLADVLAGHPPLPWQELDELITRLAPVAETQEIRDACFLYPEVSANVQGFIRSRTSKEGIYLFSDTGAGTVDQSLFFFVLKDGTEHLTYLHASVLPLGSSQIEHRAARTAGSEEWTELERWRQRKESGMADQAITRAKQEISEELKQETLKTICLAKAKLISPQQINDLRVIFGGGGHTNFPYATAVLDQFDSAYFRQEEIKARRMQGDTLHLGMPLPARDELDVEESSRGWMNRLSVAFGLSYLPSELATFTVPDQVETPDPKRVWRPKSMQDAAVSKDDC
jgi:hypothetical protein